MTGAGPSPSHDGNTPRGAPGPYVFSACPELGRPLGRGDFLTTLEALKTARWPDRALALVVLDIDHFEWVNEAFGPEIGDHVLERTGERLRRYAGANGIVGRLDGDEFGVAIFVEGTVAARRAGQEALALVNQPLEVDGRRLRLTARAGVGTSLVSRDPVRVLMNRAKWALRRAKAVDTGQPMVCGASDWGSVERRGNVLRQMHSALETNQFRMAFQPIVDLNSMGVDLFEALVRWQGDEGHEVTPGEFIPLAEETGLIFPLGNWVLRKSVEAVSSLTTRAGRAVTVAINISGRQLSEPALVPLVSHLLKVHGAGASQVALEISERTVVGSWLAISKLQALRGLGCLVGLDDFGTGQSCLSYLASLPLDFIKIDRSFVSQLAADSRALRLVTTIVSFARDLGLMTIAEGVETPEQRDATTEAGCSHAQGYLFGRPAFLEDLGTVCPCA